VSLPIFLVSMAAMMLPSELPLFRLDYATARSPVRTAALTSGYLALWLVLAWGMWMLPWTPAAWILLGLAAVYQLTPMKARCLAVCRAPLARMMHGWRDGLGGAFVMGVQNGAYCAGCCVGMLAVLLIVGMASMWWMLFLAAAVYVEKATRIGRHAPRLAAAALAAGALWAI
jgi:predicted metal-binding membrane protein